MMKINAIAVLLCLAACGQQDSVLGQNVDGQSATPEPKTSQRKASPARQEAAHEEATQEEVAHQEVAQEEAIRRILERNLPDVPEREREKVYRKEAFTDRPTQRGVQIMKEIALFAARNKAPSGYGSEYDRLDKEASVNYTNKAIEASETPVDIQNHKVFENEEEREAYIENLVRRREITYQQREGRALTNHEKQVVRSFTESQVSHREEDLKKYQEEAAQNAAPRVLPYTDAAGRAAYVKKKQEERLERFQALSSGTPVSAEQKQYLFKIAEADVLVEEARARK